MKNVAHDFLKRWAMNWKTMGNVCIVFFPLLPDLLAEAILAGARACLSRKLTSCQAASLSLPIAVSLRLNNS